MNHTLKIIRPILYLTYLSLYLLWAMTDIPFLMNAMGLLLIVLVIQAIPGSSYLNRIVALILFCLGFFSLWSAQAPLQNWITALTKNGGLVALFITLPLFSFLLSYEDYRQAIKDFFQGYIRNGKEFNILTTWLSFILGAILNLAGIHLLYSLLKENAKVYEVKDDFYKALARGNLAAIFWAPNYMSMAVVLTYTNLSWLAIAPTGFLLSCILLMIASLFFHFSSIRSPEGGKDNVTREPDLQPLFRLLGVYAGLIVMVAFFNYYTDYGILIIVSLVGLIYPLLQAVIQRKTDIYQREASNYYNNTLPKIKNEVLLFASVGFFGKALDITGAGSWITSYLHLSELPFPGITVFVIIALMGILSLLGIHPIISISALATALDPTSVGISVRAFAYTMLLGYKIGVIISPFSAMSLVMSGITGENPWKVVPRLNFIYALVISLVFSLILPFM